MFTFLLMLALVGGGAYVAGSAWRRLPDTVHADLARAIREVRLRSGTYSLKLVMEHMVDEMLASVLPSVTKSYVPNEMTFGMHPRDASRWGGYFDKLGDELRLVLLQEVRRREDLHLGDAGLRVIVRDDPAADPGRPSFSARMRESAAPAERSAARAPGAATVATQTAETAETAETATEPVRERGDERSDAVGGTPVARSDWRLRIAGRSAVPIHDAVVVGRGSGANVQIDDRNVSRTHARLSLLGDRMTIVDLDSMNGTWVNGERVDMAMLDAGDRVRVGRDVVMRVDRESTGRSDRPASIPSA